MGCLSENLKRCIHWWTDPAKRRPTLPQLNSKRKTQYSAQNTKGLYGSTSCRCNYFRDFHWTLLAVLNNISDVLETLRFDRKLTNRVYSNDVKCCWVLIFTLLRGWHAWQLLCTSEGLASCFCSHLSCILLHFTFFTRGVQTISKMNREHKPYDCCCWQTLEHVSNTHASSPSQLGGCYCFVLFQLHFPLCLMSCSCCWPNFPEKRQTYSKNPFCQSINFLECTGTISCRTWG